MTEAAIDQAFEIATPRRSQRLYVLSHLLKRPTAVVGLVIIVLVVFMALFAPWISPYGPLEQHISNAFQMPSLSHPLGTDNLGRDILTRIMYGSRTSLEIGVLAVGLGGLIGVILGMLSGYFRGWLEAGIMRVVEALLALPGMLLVIAMSTSLGTGLKALIVAIAVASTPLFARLIRGSVLITKELDYVLAAKTIGASNVRIMVWHIWPNCLQPIVVQATLGVGVAILVGAAASFLGVGVQPPSADWGQMISTGHQYIFTNWWMSVPPGVAIMLTVMGFNLLGDGLRDALDPRLRGVA
jgi:peptide/nickel transport system permease protein